MKRRTKKAEKAEYVAGEKITAGDLVSQKRTRVFRVFPAIGIALQDAKRGGRLKVAIMGDDFSVVSQRITAPPPAGELTPTDQGRG